MKSKLKKEYAKVLKEEGVESSRLKSKDKRGEGRDAGDNNDERDTIAGGRAKSDRRRSFEGRDGGPIKRTKSASSGAKEEKKVRALSPSDVGPPMPQESFRQLKKEAFSKYHPPPPSRGAASGSSGSGFGGFAGRKGQPNMGARMNVLLEKIKRDKSA